MLQTEGVPRGLLRFLVLKFLAEKPLSGAEIVEKIAQETNGKWKPSFGSIYPLQSGLQERGFNELSKVEGGIKKYTLTNEGMKFFGVHGKLGEKFMAKMQFLAPPFIEVFHFGIYDENLQSAIESAKRHSVNWK
jgi:DNA-binding PadR family transcriptional regulator